MDAKIIIMMFKAKIANRNKIETLDKGVQTDEQFEDLEIEDLKPESITRLASAVNNYNVRQDQLAKVTHKIGETFNLKRAIISYDGSKTDI